MTRPELVLTFHGTPVAEPIGHRQRVIETVVARRRQARANRVDLAGGPADERDAIA